MVSKIIVKTSHKHYSRQSNCLNSWLDGLDYIFLTDRISNGKNEFLGSTKDDYNSNEEKTVRIINTIRTSEQFDYCDWFVFIDDDAILNVPMYNELINNLDKGYVYGINIKGSYKQDVTLNYPSGGCGYIISKDVIKSSEIEMKNRQIGWEDVSLGMWMRDNNIKLSEVKLPFNGWFPFQEHWNTINNGGEEYSKQMVKNLTKEQNQFLKNHLTHHYIRWGTLMKHIDDVMKNPS